MQAMNGRLFVGGYQEGFESRLLNVLRMLLAVARKFPLPDVDVVIQQACIQAGELYVMPLQYSRIVTPLEALHLMYLSCSGMRQL